MHVLFIPSWYPRSPGDIAGSFFREQAQMLAAAGCRVGVLAPALGSLRSPVQSLLQCGTRFEMDGQVATWRSQSVNFTPRLVPAQAMLVERLVRRMYKSYVLQHGRPDILHVHSALLAGAGTLPLAEAEAIPYVLSEHSTAFARRRVGHSGISLAKVVAAGAACRVAVSRPLAALMSRILGVDAGPWQVMPNPVDPAFLRAPLTQHQRPGFRFLHISLLHEKKNVESILRAFSLRFRGEPNVSLRIGGDGPTRSALIAQAASLGISSQVEFPGSLNRSEVRAELASCDAFLLSSRFETFGVVLVEALAMGRPVIATACGGPEDIVTGETGLLVPVGDDEALADAMASMVEDHLRFPAGELRRYCARMFGPEALMRRWMELYERIVCDRSLGAVL